jgi:hypothetical protein
MEIYRSTERSQSRVLRGICRRESAWLKKTGSLALILCLFLCLISCRQVIPPVTVALPVPSAPPPPPPPSELFPSSSEIAKIARTAEDLPEPVLMPLPSELIPTLPPCPPPLPQGDWGIIVKKQKRKLELYQRCQLLKVFPIDLGENPKGPKLFQGDMRTPEGLYQVIEKKDWGQTKYYLAFLLDYPNKRDRVRYDQALLKGTIPKEIGIGGLIEIHGEGKGLDWTQGCIALHNPHMQELFASIPVGTPVWIEP